MNLDDLLKDPQTAFWAGFISTCIFFGLYLITLIYGKRVYNYLFRDEEAHLPIGEYEKQIQARLHAYESLIKSRLEVSRQEIERRYARFKGT